MYNISRPHKNYHACNYDFYRKNMLLTLAKVHKARSSSKQYELLPRAYCVKTLYNYIVILKYLKYLYRISQKSSMISFLVRTVLTSNLTLKQTKLSDPKHPFFLTWPRPPEMTMQKETRVMLEGPQQDCENFMECNQTFKKFIRNRI